MKGFNAEKISNEMAKLAGNRYLTAIRDGMAVIIPVAIVGSFFTILTQLPIDSWKAFIKPYTVALSLPITFSIGLMGLYSCYAIAASLAQTYKLDRNSSATIAVMVFLLLVIKPGTITAKISKLSGIAAGTVLPSQNFGAYGLFTAMLSAIVSVEVIRFFKEKHLVIKMPKGVPASVSNSFTALIPAAVLIIGAWIIKEGLHFDVNAGLLSLLSPLAHFGKDNFVSVITPIFFNSLFWLFGVHGAISSTPVYPYWYKNLYANISAVSKGATAATAPHFMTEQFFQFFVYIGGSGAILALCILLAFFSKSAMGKTLGKVVIIPSIFNINEPIIFGLPIVLNPYFAAPFILAPIADGIITWFAMITHLVNRTIALVPWTLPAPIGAYMATGFDWRAIILTIINIFVAILIYFPFFKIWDKRQLEKEKTAAANK
ncbi:PTS sugar transporter subunit IIC [Liquorilactobacillus vini]|uniref:Permease IIC component n=1 Tax=Liquorilactobacillus vini DSM 20605 TaxID=1133569 RepID=A0A0R2CG79_9LACO|nr:PTS transporter subunit EIIC [Liquorilactobacillus vini]KRM86659.1 cellobiose-specific PTS system IIC component [Liquorilactobacillus vini DSM 20605]